MIPTVGRTVHYIMGDGAAPLAAVISRVDGPLDFSGWGSEDERSYSVNLHVFTQDGVSVACQVLFQSVGVTPHWTWPPRV